MAYTPKINDISLYPNEGGPAFPTTRPQIGLFDDFNAFEPDRNRYAINPQDPKTMKSYSMWRQMAQQQGPTQFGQQALGQIEQNKQRQLGALPQQAMGQQAQAASSLGMRGGMRGTMGSRLTNNLNNQTMMNKQGIYRGSQNSILDALKNDEALKTSAMDKWAGAESGYAMDNQEAQQRQYELDLRKWAAGVGADAFKTIKG